MSTQMDFDKGQAYFDVDYSENELIVPNIDTYIYVGKNLFDGDEEQFYFQTPDCFFKHGPFFEVTDEAVKKELEIIL